MECLAVYAVAIAQEITRSSIPGEGLQQLLGCPFRGRMSSDCEVNGAATVMRKDDEYKQQAKRSGRNDKEISGDQLLDVIPQEGTPRLGRREPVPHHVLSDRCLRDVDAEFAQLAVNAWCTPAWVGGADASNQLSHLGRYRWTTMARTASPTPIEPIAFSVPGDHGLRSYDAKRRFPVWPNTRQPNPEKTIRGRQLVSPFLVPALENKKLMAQGEGFCLKRSARTERITKSGEEESQNRRHHKSLLPHRAKCDQFSENEFWAGTGGKR